MKRLLFAAALFVLPPLHAGQNTFKESAASEESAPWEGSLSAGWDSLYMFRGVNQLPGFEGYGSSLSWTALELTVHLTGADSLTFGTWMAFGLSESDYKEIDGLATYTHTIGALSLSLGYALYAVPSETNGLYNNELNIAAAYEMKCGTVTLTPGIAYAFNLGPAPGNRGYVEQASSYLEIRLDGEVPLFHDVVSMAPWAALGVNFRNNTTGGATPTPFVGADHVEIGAALPIALCEGVSLAPYVATSFQWSDFPGTRPATVWGGASVAFSF
jgi:hypothetical protein